MSEEGRIHNIDNIEFKVIYSRRRTLGISILPDAKVLVRAPLRTSFKMIERIIRQKSDWIIKHRDRSKERAKSKTDLKYISGEKHLFRGKECILNIYKSDTFFMRFNENKIELGTVNTDDPIAIKNLLYKGYSLEAGRVFGDLLNKVLLKFNVQKFRPSQLVIRKMKSRWGSCSSKGRITLNTELIKLPDRHIEYVIVHELCHLKYPNHGAGYYALLSELFPDWRIVRSELKSHLSY